MPNLALTAWVILSLLAVPAANIILGVGGDFIERLSFAERVFAVVLLLCWIAVPIALLL